MHKTENECARTADVRYGLAESLRELSQSVHLHASRVNAWCMKRARARNGAPGHGVSRGAQFLSYLSHAGVWEL